MLRKVKKFTSLFLVAALVLVFFIPASADASIIGGNTGGGVIPPEDSVVHTYLGSQITDELWDTLEEIGVELNADTILQARPMNETNDSLVLTITNMEGHLVTTDLFMAFDHNGSTDVVDIDASGTMTYGARGMDLPVSPVVIRAIAAYNYYNTDYMYCQPLNLQAAYINTSYELEYMTVRFCCDGYEHTYPDFELLDGLNINDDEDIYIHIIEINQESPRYNMYYFKSNPYNPDRVLRTNYIGPAGIDNPYFYYIIKMNGEWSTGAVSFSGGIQP